MVSNRATMTLALQADGTVYLDPVFKCLNGYPALRLSGIQCKKEPAAEASRIYSLSSVLSDTHNL